MRMEITTRMVLLLIDEHARLSNKDMQGLGLFSIMKKDSN